MDKIIDWITGKDVKYFYRLNKISLYEAENIVTKRQYFTLTCITIIVLLLLTLL